MANTGKMSAAVQRAIDSHLDAIETSLRAAGMSRSERQSIIENMENQINEMLEARVTGTPTEEDVRALLAELDAPESFAETLDSPTNEGEPPAAKTVARPSASRISKSAVIGALWSIPFFVFVPLYFILSGIIVSSDGLGVTFFGFSGWGPIPISLLLAAITAPFGTTILGIISISQIRHSRGALYGRGLAVADALLFPLLAALAASVVIVVAVMVFLERPGEFLDPSYNHHWGAALLNPPSFLGFAVGIGVWLLVSCASIWWTLRRTKRPLPCDDEKNH